MFKINCEYRSQRFPVPDISTSSIGQGFPATLRNSRSKPESFLKFRRILAKTLGPFAKWPAPSQIGRDSEFGSNMYIGVLLIDSFSKNQLHVFKLSIFFSISRSFYMYTLFYMVIFFKYQRKLFFTLSL